jgi:hypothetical protein
VKSTRFSLLHLASRKSPLLCLCALAALIALVVNLVLQLAPLASAAKTAARAKTAGQPSQSQQNPAQLSGAGISETALNQLRALIREKASRSLAQQKLDVQILDTLKMRRGEPIAEGNEEYFGVVDIARQPHQVYNTLKTAFDSANLPPPPATTLRAVSAGWTSGNFAQFYRDDNLFYFGTGGAGGGRGFSVAAIDLCTGELLQPVQTFDTWGTRNTGVAMNAMISFLNGLPTGTLVLIAVCDEAGLTVFDGCTHLPHPWVEAGYQALEALGSTQIRNYCYRDSWAMVSIKGEGQAREEQLGHAAQVSAQTTIPVPFISPTSQTFPASGSNGSVNVTTATGCGWTAISNDAWITITSGTGSGNSIATYSVVANTGPARTGTMTIAGQAFTVTQASACSFSLHPTSQSFTAIGGMGTVNVTSGAGCTWTAASNDPWITITSGASGACNGSVTYAVAATADATRTGILTIADQTFTVTQTVTNCPFTINPTNAGFGTDGGSGGVNITASSGCNWTATSNNSWITITSGGSGNGNGAASYSVSSNTGPARTGVITIAGRALTISQAGSGSFAGDLDFTFGVVGKTTTQFPVSVDYAQGVAVQPDGKIVAAGYATNNNLGAGFALARYEGVSTCLPPSITAQPANQTVIAGQSATFSVAATGTALSYQWRKNGASVPGATANSYTISSATPNDAGSYDVVITGACGTVTSNAAMLTVNCQTITINPTNPALPSGTAGQPYSQTFTASGGTSPHSFSVSTGALPNGLTISSGGVLSGAPTAFGTFNFTIKATDATGCMGTRAYTLVINPPCGAGATTVNPATLPNGFVWITLYPFGTTQPNASNLNFHENHIVPNWFVVGLSSDGKFNIYSHAATHFIVDVAGYFSDEPVDANGPGLLYTALSKPVRLLETRPGEQGCDAPGVPLGDSATRTQTAHGTCFGETIPITAKAVVGNATVVNFISTGFHWITLYPSGAAIPNASNLNFTANHIVPNAFWVGLSNDGKFSIYSHGATHFIVDLTGYFAP